MLTGADLEQAFRVYFEEMDRCKAGQCQWALLHLVLVLPDICGALESPSKGVGDRYTGWCKENLPGRPLSPEDRYAMRCAVLHQGSSLPREGQYDSFSFMPPGAAKVEIHQAVTGGPGSGKPNITLDVERMNDEMKAGVRTWFKNLLADNTRLNNVEKNLRTLVRVQPKSLPGIEVTRHTTSST